MWIYNLAGSEGLATLDHPHRFPLLGDLAADVRPELALDRSHPGHRLPSYDHNYARIRQPLLPFELFRYVDRQLHGPDLMSITSGANPNLGHFDKTFTQQFNTGAFFAPANGVIGDAAPGIIQDPGQINFDISAAKTFNPNGAL